MLVFVFIYVCASVCVRAGHMCASAYGVPKRVSDTLQFKIQVAVSYWIWALKTELGSSGRSASALNH